MIPKIKQGNSVPVKFTVMENGEQKDMTAATGLSWNIRHAVYGCRRLPGITVVGGSNPYTIVVKTTAASPLGVYYLSLSYLLDGESRSVDAAAFELTVHSAACGCQNPEKAICLLADTCIGAPGVSAYEIYKQYHPDSELTESEYGEAPIAAADAANNASDKADTAADKAGTASEKADTAASEAREQADRAKGFADHPPKIVDVEGLRYWAFWVEGAQDYVTSEYRAEGGAIMPVFWVDPATLMLHVTYQNGYEGAKFKLENGILYTVKTIDNGRSN